MVQKLLGADKDIFILFFILFYFKEDYK